MATPTTLSVMPTRLREPTGVRCTHLTVTGGVAERPAVHMRTTGDATRPGLRVMVLGLSAGAVRVSLVPDGALLLAGDAVRLQITVGAGLRLEVVEPAGTVAYDMRGGSATWDVDVDLGDDAELRWAGEPFVVSSGAAVTRSTTARLGQGARLALREILVLGRHGERGGRVVARWQAHGPDGTPVLVEELRLDDTAFRPGLLGGNRVLGSVVALGRSYDDPGPSRGRLDLEEGGHVWRSLAASADRAMLDEAWRAVGGG